jgi:hypothetical protein
MENIYTVIITAISTLGGASAWRYFEKRATHKEDDERYIRMDCQTRITKLEILLEKASEEKDILRAQILELTAQVAKLQTLVEVLQNKEL